MNPVPTRNIVGDSPCQCFAAVIRSVAPVKSGVRTCPGKVAMRIGGLLVVISGRWQWDEQLDFFTDPIELHAGPQTIHVNLRQATLVDWDGGAVRVWVEVKL